MNRITWLELNGERYPLNMSMRAARLTMEKFGGIEQVADVMSESEAGALEAICWMLALMIQQGCAYCDLTGEPRPKRILQQEELETLLQPADIPEIQETVFTAITSGVSREVQTEDEGKNAETTQG